MEQRIKFPRSQKVYLPGKLFPNIRVAMRKVEQVPSVSFEGEEKIATPNPEVYVYDTSGPFSDTEMNIDLKKDCRECAKNGLSVAVMWSSFLKSPLNTDG